MLTGVCLFVSRRGARGKKMEQQDSFDSSIFSNVLEWGIIMKYGLDRGKLLRFVVFILVWVVQKKQVRLFQTWLFAVLGFILNSKNRFAHFSQPCIPLNLQCKFDKHTNSCVGSSVSSVYLPYWWGWLGLGVLINPKYVSWQHRHTAGVLYALHK